MKHFSLAKLKTKVMTPIGFAHTYAVVLFFDIMSFVSVRRARVKYKTKSHLLCISARSIIEQFLLYGLEVHYVATFFSFSPSLL